MRIRTQHHVSYDALGIDVLDTILFIELRHVKLMISGRIYHPIYDLHFHVVNLNLRPR